MGIIPLLILFYIIVGKDIFDNPLIRDNSLIAAISIYISVMGFFLAYTLVSNMIKKLLLYSAERKQADEEKTELLLAVTHDLKTPLAVIKTSVQNILDGVGGAVSEIHAEMAKICLTAVNKITTFTNELLDISKIKFVRMNFRRELLEFAKVVRSEVRGISELAKEKQHDLKCRIPQEDSRIWADKQKVSRAVMNLLSNAVKYTPSGGVIDVILSVDESAVKLSVMNTGPGIPKHQLEDIFNKYKRLQKHAQVEGTGLGLSIVKDIVDLHKGHLTANSEPGKKTEFSIVLPKDLRAGKRS